MATNDNYIRLNRVIANAGISSRREADDLIKAGLVTVNGKVCTEMGVKVGPEDEIKYGGERVRREQFRYILVNKPKHFTTAPSKGRAQNSVFDIIKNVCKESVGAIGKLDKDDTGLILLTNDQEIAEKINRSKKGIHVTYKVELDKNLSPVHVEELLSGIKFERFTVKYDEAFFPDKEDHKVVIVILHTTKNNIIRKTFETLGYKAKRIDRLSYAGLEKGELNRGKWRYLTDKEIGFLKMIR